jgi:hypothetical protein
VGQKMGQYRAALSAKKRRKKAHTQRAREAPGVTTVYYTYAQKCSVKILYGIDLGVAADGTVRRWP